jgi:hypothetical protein
MILEFYNDLYVHFFAYTKKRTKEIQPFTWFRVAELPCAAPKKQTPRNVAYTPLSRFSAFCSAAQRRKMA